MEEKKIAVFASGSGTNAENIINYFAGNVNFTVDSLWCNNENAFVLKRAEKLKIDTFLFDRKQFYNSDNILKKLVERKINLIVLSGFLWLVPDYIIERFPIINIHPALLPKYGGKGMYGMRVHEEVVKNGEKETGISIHIVNKNYDEGKVIFQAKCPVLSTDSPEIVAGKVHELEYKYFPEIIEKYLKGEYE